MKAFIFSLLLSVATVGLNAGTFTDSSTGISFPDEVTFEDNGTSYTLDATGVATRKKFIVKVYSIAHYMQDPQKTSSQNAFDEILNSDKAKQFTMIWARSVDSKKIRDAYEDAFDQVLSKNEQRQMKSEINKFLNFFKGDSNKNDKYIFRWLPGGKLLVNINGRNVGEIDNQKFAKAVWEIWFNPKSVVSRNRLVSKM